MTREEAQVILDSFTIEVVAGIPWIDSRDLVAAELERRAGTLDSNLEFEKRRELLLKCIMEQGDPRGWDFVRVPCGCCGKEMAPTVVSEPEQARLLRIYAVMVLRRESSAALDRFNARCTAEALMPSECIRRYGDPADWPEAS